METTFLKMENSKTNEPHKFVLTLPQRLDLRSLDKHVCLQNLYIYHTWKNIIQQYKNNKLKKIAPTRNDEIELPDGSYSGSYIQDDIEHIIKALQTNQNFSYSCQHQQDLKQISFENKGCIKARITNALDHEIIWRHEEIKRQNKEWEKMWEVFRWLKQSQYNAIQQIININKSLRYYTFLYPINLMIIS